MRFYKIKPIIISSSIVICFIIVIVSLTDIVSAQGLVAPTAPTAPHTDPSLNTNPILKWVEFFVNVLAVTILAGASVMIAWAGIQYTSARDNAQNVQAAKQKIWNVIIGLLAFFFLYGFVQWLIPGGVFNENSSVATVQPQQPEASNPSGGATPVTQPAITSLSGVSNFRDAGASGFLKTGTLYRSGKLENANAQQLKTLLSGGTIIDLRTASVISRYPDVSVNGVNTINYAIHGTEDYTEFVLNADSRAGFKNAITAIANEDGPVLIHCTYGKDRTGWTIAMIMYAVGANNSQVMTEYLKSNDVNASMLESGLSKAREEYGSITNYLKTGLGLTDQTISKLKTKLLE